MDPWSIQRFEGVAVRRVGDPKFAQQEIVHAEHVDLRGPRHVGGERCDLRLALEHGEAVAPPQSPMNSGWRI